MSSGARLCSLLAELGYEGHESLHPDSFEWSFQYEEVRPLLDWICSSLRPTNVLSPSNLSLDFDEQLDGCLNGSRVETTFIDCLPGSLAAVICSLDCCQICSMNSHLAYKCPFMYTSCTKPNCTGIRKLKISGTIYNPNRKFLRCQFSECNGFQWLDEAVLQIRGSARGSVASSSNLHGCFSCEEDGHWCKDCPWKASSCFKPECNGVRRLLISNFVKSKGERYLKSPKCDSFEWLKDARAQEKENERKRASKKKFLMMAVNEEASIEEICSSVKHMMIFVEMVVL